MKRRVVEASCSCQHEIYRTTRKVTAHSLDKVPMYFDLRLNKVGRDRERQGRQEHMYPAHAMSAPNRMIGK